MEDMLQDVKVLELASVLAGPSVGQFFAELGAEVIKVENLHGGGDVTRSWKGAHEQTDDRSAYFCAVNWGKRSVALDLHTEAGREAVRRLARRADVVIASYKPGDAARLGVDYDTLSRENPRLIYGQITGYGEHNPRVGYDAVIQAEAGFMYMNGEPGGASLKMPVALVDVLAGHQLKEALLLALWRRERTGRGDCVSVSLLDAAVASLVNQATNWLVAGKLPGKHGSAHPNIAPYGDVLVSGDGQEILLAVGNDRQFQDLCLVLAVPLVAQDERFRTNPQRVAHRQALMDVLASPALNYDAATLMTQLHAHKVPAAMIQHLGQTFAMPEVEALVLRAAGVAGVRGYVGQHRAGQSAALLPPPHFGEHTAEVLSWIQDAS